jgi:hypothetical protein
MFLLVGNEKRAVNIRPQDYEKLKSQIFYGEPLELGFGMFGTPEMPDMTLPLLRNEVMGMEYMTAADRRRTKDAEDKKAKREDCAEELKEERAKKYEYIRKRGGTAKQARDGRFFNWKNVFVLCEKISKNNSK